MSFIDRLFRKQPKFDYSPSSGWTIPPGMNVGQYLQSYGQIGWLFGCVSRIAAGVADVKWRLYRGKGAKRKEIEEHPLLDLLSYVNDFQTQYELFELSQIYLDLTGECFWVINKDMLGKPGEIWIVPPSRMKVIPDKKKFIGGYIYEFGAEKVPLKTEEVIFFKSPNPADPYRGIGPAQSISTDLQSEQFAAQYNRNFFANDATPGLVISYPDSVGEEEYQRLLAQFTSKHGGVSRAHKVAILSGGAEISKVSISQRDMDFWRLRKLSRDIILGAYGVPLTAMGISESVNRANAEAGHYIMGQWVIKPRVTRFRGKMNEQLCPMFEKGIYLDYDDPVPENRQLVIDEVEKGIRSAVLTRNEGRKRLGYEEKPGGDVFLVPLNMIEVPVGQAAPRPEPKPTTQPPKAKTALSDDRKEAIWRAYIVKTERQEKPFISAMEGIFRDQEKTVLARLKGATKPQDALFDKSSAEKTTKDALVPLLKSVMGVAIEDAEELIAPAQAHTDAVKQADVSGDALVWLMDHAGEAVVNITATTLNSLRVQLTDGFAAGEGIPDLTKRVQSVFETATKHRAEMIARTEVIDASSEGAIEGYKASGVIEESEFFAALDEKVCSECEDLHGTIFPLKDTGGIISVHTGCRCIWLPVI